MNFVDYKNPRPLSAPLSELEEAFIENLVDKGMTVEDAFIAAGYGKRAKDPDKGTNKETAFNVPNRSRRLQRHLWIHINDRIKRQVDDNARAAVRVLEQLMLTAESENVRLNAARDMLSRAGYDAVQRQETTFKDVSNLSEQEIEDQLKNMLRLPDDKKGNNPIDLVTPKVVNLKKR